MVGFVEPNDTVEEVEAKARRAVELLAKASTPAERQQYEREAEALMSRARRMRQRANRFLL